VLAPADTEDDGNSAGGGSPTNGTDVTNNSDEINPGPWACYTNEPCNVAIWGTRDKKTGKAKGVVINFTY
jgi:hypothetical protein